MRDCLGGTCLGDCLGGTCLGGTCLLERCSVPKGSLEHVPCTYCILQTAYCKGAAALKQVAKWEGRVHQQQAWRLLLCVCVRLQALHCASCTVHRALLPRAPVPHAGAAPPTAPTPGLLRGCAAPLVITSQEVTKEELTVDTAVGAAVQPPAVPAHARRAGC